MENSTSTFGKWIITTRKDGDSVYGIVTHSELAGRTTNYVKTDAKDFHGQVVFENEAILPNYVVRRVKKVLRALYAVTKERPRIALKTMEKALVRVKTASGFSYQYKRIRRESGIEGSYVIIKGVKYPVERCDPSELPSVLYKTLPPLTGQKAIENVLEEKSPNTGLEGLQ